MGLAIPIETSARHIHMCEKDFEILFGEGRSLTFKAELWGGAWFTVAFYNSEQ